MGFLTWLLGKQQNKAQITYLSGPGAYSFDIVGESKYQPALESICKRNFANNQKMATACIICDDNNPYDKNAVRVEISGKAVGYFSRENAKLFRAKMKEQNLAANIKCSALIVGGWDRGHGDKGDFGVKLDLPSSYQYSFELNDLTDNIEFDFVIDKLKKEELKYLKIGDHVNLWLPKGVTDKIYIFRNGTIGGEGKVGMVPQTHVNIISNHLSAKLPIHNEIIEVTSISCKIHCRLISKEEAQVEKNKQQQKLLAELKKPYHPKKPMEFSACTKDTFEIGERLRFYEIPSMNNCTENIYAVNITFSSIDGMRFIKKNTELLVKKKLIRLINTYNSFNIIIKSKTLVKTWIEEKYEYCDEHISLRRPDKRNTYEYRISIIPDMPKSE